ADDGDVLSCHGRRLGGRGAVVDARAGERVDTGRLEARVAHSGGHERAVAADLLAAVERDHSGRTILADGQHPPAQHLPPGPTPPRHGPPRPSGPAGAAAPRPGPPPPPRGGRRGYFRCPSLAPPSPPAASRSTRSVRSPSDAPYTAAARPAGPPPTMTKSYSVDRAVVCSPSRCATSRNGGRESRVPSGKPSAGPASSDVQRGQRVASSVDSGVSQSKTTWLRPRKRRRSWQDGSQRWPMTVTCGVGGFAASP